MDGGKSDGHAGGKGTIRSGNKGTRFKEVSNVSKHETKYEISEMTKELLQELQRLMS